MTTQVPSNDDNNLKHNDSVASSLSSTSSKRHLVGGGSSSSNDNNNSFLSSKKTKIIKMAAKSTSKTEEQTEFVPPDGGFQVSKENIFLASIFNFVYLCSSGLARDDLQFSMQRCDFWYPQLFWCSL